MTTTIREGSRLRRLAARTAATLLAVCLIVYVASILAWTKWDNGRGCVAGIDSGTLFFAWCAPAPDQIMFPGWQLARAGRVTIIWPLVIRVRRGFVFVRVALWIFVGALSLAWVVIARSGPQPGCCRKCGYDLQGLAASANGDSGGGVVVCPDCGSTSGPAGDRLNSPPQESENHSR
jgi:hypothetical protein